MVTDGRIETTLTAMNEAGMVPAAPPLEPPPPAETITVYFSVDADGFITGYSSSSTGENCTEMELPRDHPIFGDDYLSWQVVDGELIKDEIRQEQLMQQAQAEALAPSVEERLRTAEEIINTLLGL